MSKGKLKLKNEKFLSVFELRHSGNGQHLVSGGFAKFSLKLLGCR